MFHARQTTGSTCSKRRSTMSGGLSGYPPLPEFMPGDRLTRRLPLDALAGLELVGHPRLAWPRERFVRL